jgi:transcriptional regulator with XRE-family HTH domain
MTDEKKQHAREQIGQRISEIRKAQGISQTELAERSGVGRTHLIRIEQGKYNLQIDTLAALADAMNFKIDFVEK